MRAGKHRIAVAIGAKLSEVNRPIERHPSVAAGGSAFAPHGPERGRATSHRHPPWRFRAIRGRSFLELLDAPNDARAGCGPHLPPRADRGAAPRHRSRGGHDRDRARDAALRVRRTTAYRRLPMVVLLPSTTAHVP